MFSNKVMKFYRSTALFWLLTYAVSKYHRCYECSEC